MRGGVKELTCGKYAFDFEIPKDTITKDALLEAGISQENMVADKSRDTLLALFLNRPIAWGYRTEIEVDIGFGRNKLLDIATLEYFLWDPIYQGRPSSQNIVNLKDISYTLALSVTGLERLYMAAKGLIDIRKVDYLQEFYRSLETKEGLCPQFAELIRTVHFIFSDLVKFKLELGKHRGYMVNRMIREIPLNINRIEELLQINAASQPWYPHLKDGIGETLLAIEKYRKTREILG